VTVPVRDGSINYFGARSGELAQYIGTLCPAKVKKGDNPAPYFCLLYISEGAVCLVHSPVIKLNGKAAALSDDEEDDDENEDDDLISNTTVASFRLVFPTRAERDLVVCLARVLVAEKLCMIPEHSSRSVVYADNLPWNLSDAVLLEAQTKKEMQEKAQQAALEALLTTGERICLNKTKSRR